MSANYVGTLKKLQRALNNKGYRFLYCTSEFYCEDINRPITMFYIKHATNVNGRVDNKVLLKTASQLKALFFLRDILEMSDSEISFDDMIAIALDKQRTYDFRRDVREHTPYNRG